MASKTSGASGPGHRVEVRLRPALEDVRIHGEEAGPRSSSRTFAQYLIDREEDRTLRAVLVGMLREMERGLRAIQGFE